VSRIRSHLTYANVVATICLFLVLGGGTALASYVVSSNSQIGPGTISGHNPPSGKHANVVGGSINGGDLQNGSIGLLKLKANATPVPPGPTTLPGPRINPATVQVDTAAKTVAFEANSALKASSVSNAAFQVSVLSGSGWASDPVTNAVLAGDNRSVSVALQNIPSGSVLRLIVKGTGSTPVVGANGSPLAGATAGPPGSDWDGHDFVYMTKLG
jgi:hypothetical protein